MFECVLDLLRDVVQHRAPYEVHAQRRQSECAFLPFKCLDGRDSVFVHRKHVVECAVRGFEGV